jgi:hypothetical protein
MATYEYKVIPAPGAGARGRTGGTDEEHFSRLFETALNAQAAQGWEFLRSETVPFQHRHKFTGRVSVIQQAMLVFRRATDPVTTALPRTAGAAQSAPMPPLRATTPGPVIPSLGPARPEFAGRGQQSPKAGAAIFSTPRLGTD